MSSISGLTSLGLSSISSPATQGCIGGVGTPPTANNVPLVRNCLVGCMKNYETNENKVHKALNSPGLMPWVQVWFSDNASNKIGVSNVSSCNTMAVIESFSFGMSNGFGVEVVVVDESGGTLSQFILRITRGNFQATRSGWILQWQFGWATSNCDGSASTFAPPSDTSLIGGIHRAHITNTTAEVTNNNMIKYKFIATDFNSDLFTTRGMGVHGTDSNPMPVTQAIREMCDRLNIDVAFLAEDGQTPMQFQIVGNTLSQAVLAIGAPFGGVGFPTGSLPPVTFVANAVGPVRSWREAGRNPLQNARNWLDGCLTAKGRGIICFWSSMATNRPLLICMESSIPASPSETPQYNSLGTYIVGGNCSPVIKFVPKAEYIMTTVNTAPGTSGGSGSATDNRARFANQQRAFDPGLQQDPTAGVSSQQGLQTGLGMMDDGWYSVYGLEHGWRTSDARMINVRSNWVKPGIEAELEIQGDPSYDNPILWRGKTLTIIKMNPMPIQAYPATNNVSGGCNYLISATNCQIEFSNKTWLIIRVHHSITPGKFVTTIGIKLLAPAQDIGPRNPIGDVPGGVLFPIVPGIIL